MILGTMLLMIALLAAVVAAVYYFQGARGRTEMLPYARGAFYVLAGATFLACVYLLHLILGHQFQVEYVFYNSSRDLEPFYLISSFWAGQEGSFLLWLALGLAYGLFLLRRKDDFEPQVMLFFLLVQIFLLVMLFVRSPFRLLGEVPPDGAGLNPLLQNPWMVLHPPILFVGYAGLALPFAYALAGLWRRDYDGWHRRAWPWTLFAWLFLGIGLALGGYWAYETLGWGGYWGWDPVENSSLVPWLTGTALLHGMIVQKARGSLRRWNLVLAVTTFLLVTYAAFLTRSGVLSDFSVHTFGNEGYGQFMLAFMVLFGSASAWLLVKRWNEIPARQIYETVISRDFAFLLTVLILAASATIVALGTSTPIFTGLLGQPSKVAESFYNATNAPLALLLALVLSLCPVLGWRESSKEHLFRKLSIPGALAALVTIAVALMGFTLPWVLACVFFATFAVAVNVQTLADVRSGGLWKLGGYLAHIGVGLTLVGIVGSSVYSQSTVVKLEEGKAAQAFGYSLALEPIQGPSATGWYWLPIQVSRGTERFVAEPRLFPKSEEQIYRTPSVKKYLLEDLYIAPGDYVPGGLPADRGALELQKGESKPYGEYTLHFLRFDFPPHSGGQAGPTAVSAVLEVTRQGVTWTISPTLGFDQSGKRQDREAALPDGKLVVSLEAINATQGTIALGLREPGAVKPAPVAASLTVEVFRKPAINLLWAGLLVLGLGAVIAFQRRREETRAVPSGISGVPKGPEAPRGVVTRAAPKAPIPTPRPAKPRARRR
ncbi:MAG: cytochrome c biogenesis protein CcsA [Chloroflexota bacterium]